jgi:hypothetical protein
MNVRNFITFNHIAQPIQEVKTEGKEYARDMDCREF